MRYLYVCVYLYGSVYLQGEEEGKAIAGGGGGEVGRGGLGTKEIEMRTIVEESWGLDQLHRSICSTRIRS